MFLYLFFFHVLFNPSPDFWIDVIIFLGHFSGYLHFYYFNEDIVYYFYQSVVVALDNFVSYKVWACGFFVFQYMYFFISYSWISCSSI